MLAACAEDSNSEKGRRDSPPSTLASAAPRRGSLRMAGLEVREDSLFDDAAKSPSRFRYDSHRPTAGLRAHLAPRWGRGGVVGQPNTAAAA